MVANPHIGPGLAVAELHLAHATHEAADVVEQPIDIREQILIQEHQVPSPYEYLIVTIENILFLI